MSSTTLCPRASRATTRRRAAAARDSKEATCILFYSYADVQKTRHMLRQSAEENRTPPDVLENNMEALHAMVNYAEEQFECRRTLLLAHFGETKLGPGAV